MTGPVWNVAAMAACAVAIRPDWDEDQTAGALAALQAVGRTAAWAMGEVCRIAGRDDGHPGELLLIARQPAHTPGTGLPPAGLLDALRADLEHRPEQEESEPSP